MIGAIISHYKILEKLGGGGMGVVYKAEDTSLKRIVALKFLPPELTSDQQARSRFLHEAQAASKIDHPNICAVHDIGETDDGQTYIVMSYYEGETLKKKIARGRLKVEQALELTTQIADGLAKAHAADIIHRDVKPANVLVTKDGIAKILDFGLAKLKGETKLTQTGATVGTLSYMAPEQVQGQETDARSDIWSLGVVLYEMLTGIPPFKGEHEGALLYEIMSADPPPLTAIIPDADPELQQFVMRCLEKDPEERYQAVKDVSVDCRRIKREMKTLKQMSASYAYTGRGDSPSVATRYPAFRSAKKNQQKYLILAVAVLFCATAVLSVREFFGSRTAEAPSLTGEIWAPEFNQFYCVGAHAGPPAFSPDGRSLAFVVRNAGGRHVLWVRQMDDPKGRMINNTDGASYPFWSPDGQSVAFFSGRMLKRVDIAREVVTELCQVGHGLGGSWSRGGTIVFSSSRTEPILRVSENGGTPVPVTTLDASKKEIYHQYPFFLPDGNHFLFLARSTFTNVKTGVDEVCVASLDGGPRKSLLPVTSNVMYSSGYLVHMNNSRTMVATPFDPASQSILGESIPITEVHINAVDGGGVFTVSQNNLLVYQRPPSTLMTRLVIFDRNGTEIGVVGRRAAYSDVRFSPDGKKVAFSVVDSLGQSLDIWIHDPSTSDGSRRFVSTVGTDRFPVWSRDGKELYYCSNKPLTNSSNFEIYRKSLSGSNEELIPTTQDYVKQTFDWSPDGRYLAFVSSASAADPKHQSDIYTYSSRAAEHVQEYLKDEANDWDPRFSPDGNWIAWCSGQTGQNEIFVSRFPGPFSPEVISYEEGGQRTGGMGPRWAKEGKELLYLTLDNKLMVVELKADGPDIRVVRRKELFQTRATTNADNYDVSPDGSRIIINTLEEQGGPLVFVSNWTRTLSKK
jgi:eukaryotic-like serine/threonine-protein kinase